MSCSSLALEILTLRQQLATHERTVLRLVWRAPKPPLLTWRTFLDNPVATLVSVDFFVTRAVTFELLYVFVTLQRECRRVLHLGVTSHPSAEWIGNHGVQACPFETAPRYMIRDRDGIYGAAFRRRMKQLGSEEVVSPRRAPGKIPTSRG